ncbi:MAG: glycine zipper 2TM domain-containing protein [Gammaproteobacteria bacterium]|nr:glycine zipper 2TM domain-containing protein [Gammaproteobacteria bacterium]
MKKTSILCSLILSLSLLTACTNSDVGLVGGGVLGGVAGNAITGGSAVGTAVGAVGGAFVGHSLAR